MNLWSWQPDDTPPVTSIDPALTVTAAAWPPATSLALKIETKSPTTSIAVPRAVSIRIDKTPVMARGFAFADEAWDSGDTGLNRQPGPGLVGQGLPCHEHDRENMSGQSPDLRSGAASKVGVVAGATRIKPPGDIIKLQDRLYYVLQPTLESLIASCSLGFPAQPFPFQMQGVAFLYCRHGAILADEMGLGKTMQAITAIRLLLKAGQIRRVLLVCPKPLVTNWRREFSFWAPEVPLLTIEGDQPKRHWQWRLTESPVKIANYELLVRDRDAIEDADAHFDLVVLDEAQRIKNRTSATSQAARSVSRGRSWALTGTPVENSPEDLVGIFEFLAPGQLSSNMTPRRMGRAAQDYILRRTKEKVLKDLPPKLFRDADLDLAPEQRETYQTAENEAVVRLTQMGDAVSIQHVFQLISHLKQICNFDPATGQSSKLERLTVDLEEVAASGQKAIVFSQWVRTLTTLARRLADFGPLEYHGKIPSRRRDAVIERFRNDPDCRVLLISYGAGGVGLNLQFAGYVFLFDRWWNPAVEDQAINRAHRIGAAGPVTVTRFLTLNTIEERIDEVLREKREMFEAILSQARPPRNLGLSQDEIFGLFKLKMPHGPLKAAA